MTETVRTDTTPTPAQLESWRRLWNLLLEHPAPAPETQPETDEQADCSGQGE